MCENHGIVNAQSGLVSLKDMDRRDLVRGLWTGTLVLAATGASGCSSVAKYLAPSDADLEPLAAQAWVETKAKTPISKDANANRRVMSVGQRIAAVAQIQNAQWEFVVFDSKELNAFVLPGGKVGFYKGLVDFVDNDDQMAAVLGHEVAHVARRHAALRAGEQQAEQLGLGAFQIVAGGALSSDQLGLANSVFGMGLSVASALPFSRGHESEADRIGVDYMKAAGYDVKQSVRLWEKMSAASTQRPMEILSTHPDPANRITDLKKYITEKGYATF